MYTTTKITASMILLLNSNPVNARTESFARCELKKGWNQSSERVIGKFLIAHYKGTDLYITGNVKQLDPGSEHYLSVTNKSFFSSAFSKCDSVTGSFWEPYSTSDGAYNHLRAVIAD